MKRIIQLAGAAAAVFALAACGSSGASRSSGDSLEVAIDAEALCYLPSMCYAQIGSGLVVNNVLQTLVRQTKNEQGFDYSLAENIVSANDFTKFSVVLKPNVKWSDGTSLVAMDVKTLFETYFMAKTSVFAAMLDSVASIETPDEKTVVFTLDAPNASFPLTLMPMALWKPVPDATLKTLPIGTGPYKFESWQPNGVTKLVKNEYALEQPEFETVNVRAIPSSQTRVNELQAGNIDIAMSADRLTIDKFGQAGAETYSSEDNVGNIIYLNAGRAPLDDVRVRTALAYATDKESVLSAVGGGDARSQYWQSSSPWFSETADKETPSFDLSKARELIAQYVNDPSRSDGKSTGSPITVDYKYDSAVLSQQSVAALIQQQWKEAGFEVGLTAVQSSVIFQDWASGNYDTSYGAAGYPDPYGLFTNFYSDSATAQGTNFNHFKSDDLNRIQQQMQLAAPGPALNDLAHQSGMVFAEQVPFVFIDSTTSGFGVSKNLSEPEFRSFGTLDLGSIRTK